MTKPKIICVVGPNAAGKSDLAVKLAKKFGGEVVSADSRQVYRGLDIGTGKITKKEMAGVRHHLLNVASPRRQFTVARYQKLAKQAIKNILARGRRPIICGGTGFYIQALVDDLALPAVKPDQPLRKQLERKSTAELIRRLEQLDPDRAQNIDQRNRRRLIRAIEIAKQLGPVPPLTRGPAQYEFLKIGLKKNSQELKKLIRRRLKKRIKAGLIAEVAGLHRQGLSWSRLLNFGLEYRFVALYLQGQFAKKEMEEKLAAAIRQYAKRQLTWFKRDKEIKWTKNYAEAEQLTKNFLKN